MNKRILSIAERIRQTLKWGRPTVDACLWEVLLSHRGFKARPGNPGYQRAILWCAANCREAFHDSCDPATGWSFNFEGATDTANFVLAEQSGAF